MATSRHNGEGTGRPPGRPRGKTAARTKVAESVSVQEFDDGEITTKTEEFVHDPVAQAETSYELVSIDGCDTDLLLYAEYSQGATYNEIASKFRRTATDVQARIEAAHRKMTDQCEDGDVSGLRRRLDMEYTRIGGMALREFQKSQREKKTVIKKDGVVGDKETAMVETRTDGSPPGDPRFLNVAIVAAEHRSKLWGVEAPKKVEHTGVVAGTLRVEHVHQSLQDADDDTLSVMANAFYAVQSMAKKLTVDSTAVRRGT